MRGPQGPVQRLCLVVRPIDPGGSGCPADCACLTSSVPTAQEAGTIISPSLGCNTRVTAVVSDLSEVMELENNIVRMKISTGVYRPQPSGQTPPTALPDGPGTIFRWLREVQRAVSPSTWKAWDSHLSVHEYRVWSAATLARGAVCAAVRSGSGDRGHVTTEPQTLTAGPFRRSRGPV